MLRIILPFLLLINPAFAQEGQQASALPTFLLLGGLVIFMFFMIRSNKKRIKAHEQLISSLKSGDEVVLHSGIVGRIKKMGDNFAEVEIANNVIVKIQRQSINSLLPKGSYKGDLN